MGFNNVFLPPISKLNSKTVPVLPSVNHFLIISFHLLPSPVHPIGFSFRFFPDLLAIFILSSNNNNLNVQSRWMPQLQPACYL